MKQSQLQNHDGIWNAVIETITAADDPTENPVFEEAFLVFQYYAETESGGHEHFLDSLKEYIEQHGTDQAVGQLTERLEKIGASAYAEIEKSI